MAPSELIWRGLAERAIGASLDKLRRRSAEGVAIAPLYPRSADDPHQPWRREADWSVAQRVDHPDAEAANRLALLDLEGGADALVLVGMASPYARGFGSDLSNHTLDVVLGKVELDFIGLRIDAGLGTEGALEALVHLVTERRLTSAALAVDIGFDPIGWQARLGATIADDVSPILALQAKAGLGGTAFLADGRPWHEAGAGEAQELAAILATAVAYLRRQETLGVALDVGRRNIALLLAVDADVVLGLAKVRAMRRLWARIETACGLAPEPVRLLAETSWRMMTRRDPWTNVMRVTAATFAAGLGGADAIDVLPFTLPLGLPDAPSRRLARNVQRVLLDEANLGRVEDPAAGAGGFEALTEALCLEAWALFQAIEGEGGIARTLESGSLKTSIAATAQTRAQGIATSTHGLIGTNHFASLAIPEVRVLDVGACAPLRQGPGALPAIRDAAPFEALRDRAERLATTPKVFLATFGAPAAFGARATYATNFFAAGGLSAQAPLESMSSEGLIASFKAEGSPIACLCGTDEAYAAEAATIAAALREAGALRIFLIGRPDELGAAWREIGVDAVIQDGCDMLKILGDALEFASQGRV